MNRAWSWTGLLGLVLGCMGARREPTPGAHVPDVAIRSTDVFTTDVGTLVDGRFTPRDWRRLRRHRHVPTPPPSPTNRVADDLRAAALGRSLFHDAGLSRDGTVSCAGCHRPDHDFTDGRALAEAQDPPVRGRRNTPSLWGVAWKRWQTWDGAADSLWAQPALAFENAREHATTPLAVARYVAGRYRRPYETLFGALPMRDTDRAAVDRVVANVGKSIEAYERTLVPAPAAFDRYLDGDFRAMTPVARDGALVFLRAGCPRCHNGPMFTDGEFHVVRMPDDPAVGADLGRQGAYARSRASAFRGSGPYSDDPVAGAPPDEVTTEEERRGQFLTPGLRGVSRTAPYGHAGTFATLEAVVLHYVRGGLPEGDPRAQGRLDGLVQPFRADAADIHSLLAFLDALTPEPVLTTRP